MKTKSKTIVFFGSGPVAAKSLKFLVNNFEVEAVITKPKPPHHRGSVPVLELAIELNIKTYTVTNKQQLDELLKKSAFKSKVGVLIDFAIIVSKESIDSFPLGIVNSHFSLLPQWRGPDPITYSILSGQEYSGTSLMLLAPGVDEGPLLAQAKFNIPEDMTTPELTNELIDLSNHTLKEVLPLYIDGKIDPAPQEQATLSPTDKPSYSHKLNKKDGIIDWNKPAEQIEREIRAYKGWPGSRTTLFGKDVIITKAHSVASDGTTGKVEVVEGPAKGKAVALNVFAKSGYLCIERLKPAGKKEMDASAFLLGLKS